MLTRYNVHQPSMSSRKSIRYSLPGACPVRGRVSRADGPARRRGWLALALLLPLAFILHTGRALAANGAVPARVSAAREAPADAELALCEFADISIAAGPGACAAAADAEASDTEASDADARGAPMCDNSAASIAAAPEVPEVDRGQFEPARCDVQRLLSLLRSDDRAGSANVISGDVIFGNGGKKPVPAPIRLQLERLDAACAGGQHWPVPSAPSIVAFEAPRGLGWQRGHSARIERPPSQR